MMEHVAGKNFDNGMAAWQEYQKAPWGKLRYRIARANLEPHLPSPPAHILDLGGGNGFDAVPLAKDGFTISVLDFSAEMITQGMRLAQAEGAIKKVTFAAGDATQLSEYFSGPTFDAVLCHNVVQYVSEPTAVLQSIHNTLKPNGILSLMITNPHAETFSYALREYDMQTALENLDKRTKYVELFDTTIQRYTDNELTSIL
ncbi:MAG: methyltransferase domain-containing protein, partial [Anaerolineales bacterium]|nr:methyltransferase domain-containing protein [Anaerolineales bacterium]